MATMMRTTTGLIQLKNNPMEKLPLNPKPLNPTMMKTATIMTNMVMSAMLRATISMAIMMRTTTGLIPLLNSSHTKYTLSSDIDCLALCIT